jgi:hypothetical protein
MYYYIWIRSSKGRSEQFWTGTAWTTILQFGKVYSFNEAIEIMEKRFHSKLPKPLIQPEGYFIESEFRRKKRQQKEVNEN